MTNPEYGKLLYHMTSLDNIPNIIQYGLRARTQLPGIHFTDTANPEIINKRKRLNLSNYIPFHFQTRSPYDYAVCSKHTGGSRNMVIIAVTREFARANNALVCPIHPAGTEKPVLYPYDQGIKMVDWIYLDRHGVPESDYDRRARMAEADLAMIIEPQNFRWIYVYDENARNFILQNTDFPANRITVNPNMFPRFGRIG